MPVIYGTPSMERRQFIPQLMPIVQEIRHGIPPLAGKPLNILRIGSTKAIESPSELNNHPKPNRTHIPISNRYLQPTPI